MKKCKILLLLLQNLGFFKFIFGEVLILKLRNKKNKKQKQKKKGKECIHFFWRNVQILQIQIIEITRTRFFRWCVTCEWNVIRNIYCSKNWIYLESTFKEILLDFFEWENCKNRVILLHESEIIRKTIW